MAAYVNSTFNFGFWLFPTFTLINQRMKLDTSAVLLHKGEVWGKVEMTSKVLLEKDETFAELTLIHVVINASILESEEAK